MAALQARKSKEAATVTQVLIALIATAAAAVIGSTNR
jgi:hypothetical protein